jgi:hypothetical protein
MDSAGSGGYKEGGLKSFLLIIGPLLLDGCLLRRLQRLRWLRGYMITVLDICLVLFAWLLLDRSFDRIATMLDNSIAVFPCCLLCCALSFCPQHL